MFLWVSFLNCLFSSIDLSVAAVSLKTFAAGLLSFALFFWAWALKNTAGMDPSNVDLGVVSFGGVVATSSYLLALANVRAPRPGAMTRFAVIASHILVALNYLLGAYLGFTILGRPGFGAYCAIFVALWLGIAYLGSRLMKNHGPQSASENQGLLP
jgi:hypothetical protein